MKFIQGENRNQIFIFPVSIDESISKDNEVRIIDLFVESINIKDFGFKVDFVENGRPAYRPADLLKLYLYGYLNKVRSSRDLEKECKRNIEVMWLLKGLKPDHNTISNFRRDNPDAIRKVFRATVQIAKHFKLIGGKLLAGDSTKMRAQNSKKNNYNEGKVTRHVEYIDKKLAEYSEVLASADGDKETAKKEIKKHQKRKQKYEQIEQQLNETGQEQVSTSDTDSRQMITRNNITEVAYNVQTTVDAENCLIIDYKVTNNNDSKAMGDMVVRAAGIVENTEFTALYDKGFHTGSELKTAQRLGIETLVAIPDPASNAPDERYNIAGFNYDKRTDSYTCPQQHILTTNGTWYTKNRGKHRAEIQAKQYKTSECKNCPVKQLCTKSKRARVLERSEYAEYIEQNRKYLEANPELYKRRQAIVEHPYGTIKRQWGFNYILTKQGMERAAADVGFMFIAYNLRRLMNILSEDKLKSYLRKLALLFLRKSGLSNSIKSILNAFYFLIFNNNTFWKVA
jgi:transposase